MDIRKQLTDRNLKWNWDQIATYCVKHPSEISAILQCCEDEEVIIQQNAGAVLGKLIDHDRDILTSHSKKMVRLLSQDVHNAVKREVMRVYQFAPITEEVEGELFDFVVKALQDRTTAIAIKAFGMTVGRRICEKYPDLSQELIPLIEILVEEGLSAGIINRGEKELKNLRKLLDASYSS